MQYRNICTFYVAIFMCLPIKSFTQMQIRSYDPTRHERFYVGEDKEFIGKGLNWSGVGFSVGEEDVYWATLISTSYFLSSNHFHPPIGSQLAFYENNNLDGNSEIRTVEWGVQINDSDLWLGKIHEPVSEAIKWYPVLKQADYPFYLGQQLYTIGRSNSKSTGFDMRLGFNIFEGVRENLDVLIPREFDFNGSCGTNEAILSPGDSGGPSFIISNDMPYLIGIHTYVNGDTFVPMYWDGIIEYLENKKIELTVQEDIEYSPILEGEFSAILLDR